MASVFLRYRSQYFEGGRILTGAISAIDIALYDCVGKALGVPVTPAPRHATAACALASDLLLERHLSISQQLAAGCHQVYQLLGGAQRNLVPCFSTVHSASGEVLRGRKLREGEESDMVVEAKRQAEGFQCIRIGPLPPGEDGAYEPREAIAETAQLCIDIREAVGHSVVLGLE